MRLLLLGCTGFVGRELVPRLLAAGHQLTLVSRRPASGKGLPAWTPQVDWLQLDPSDSASWQTDSLVKAVQAAEGVVNLAGEPIAEERWTAQHLQTIESSRLRTTSMLVEAMARMEAPPQVLVNASAVGFYGTSSELEFNESSPSGDDFLAGLCSAWEAAAQARPDATRLLVVRIGIVLGSDGGALGKMLPIFRAGFGGPVGTGRQWMSWIHRTDLCRLIEQALIDQSWSGVVNGVGPQPVTMATFARALGMSLGRPSLLPVPGAILMMLLGDGARVVLEGQRVVSERLSKLGFSFGYPDLAEALADVTRSKAQ
ncbi:MAG: TIGR01777 family oxidoreductase [Prochlorococcus sp.]|nr:TIGR01777 family oxidoreductase [Prochlorococcaceae cyanobacterium Fu_MAG_50]